MDEFKTCEEYVFVELEEKKALIRMVCFQSFEQFPQSYPQLC